MVYLQYLGCARHDVVAYVQYKQMSIQFSGRGSARSFGMYDIVSLLNIVNDSRAVRPTDGILKRHFDYPKPKA